MYIRFVSPRRHPLSGVESGIFRIITAVLRDESQPQWLRDQIRADLNWFNQTMPVPDRMTLSFRRRATRHGVCWFRPDARSAITRARSISWAMCEAGYPIEEIYTDCPGTIFYRDAWQIVAQAGPHVPAAFH